MEFTLAFGPKPEFSFSFKLNFIIHEILISHNPERAENPNIDSGFYCLPVTFREVFFVNKVLVFFCFSQDLKKTVYK